MDSQPGLNLKYLKWIVHLHSSPCAVTTLADAACLALSGICTSPVMLPKTPKRAEQQKWELRCCVLWGGQSHTLNVTFFFSPQLGMRNAQHYLQKAAELLTNKRNVENSLFFFLFSLEFKQPLMQHQFSISLSPESVFSGRKCVLTLAAAASHVFTKQ